MSKDERVEANKVKEKKLEANLPGRYHDHTFHLYEGERLDDMVESIIEHGVLTPVIVHKVKGRYEMLSGHNRANAAKIAGMSEVPAIVKYGLTEQEAYVYVIER